MRGSRVFDETVHGRKRWSGFFVKLFNPTGPFLEISLPSARNRVWVRGRPVSREGNYQHLTRLMKFVKIVLLVVAAASLTLSSCAKKKADTTAPAPGYVEYGK